MQCAMPIAAALRSRSLTSLSLTRSLKVALPDLPPHPFPALKMYRSSVTRLTSRIRPTSSIRNLSTNAETVLSQHVSSGNYHAAVQTFIRTEQPSPRMHELLIAACANVPDPEIAHALLRSMPKPTQKAAAAAVTAYCRARDVPSAVSLLESLPSDVPISHRMASPVFRGAGSSPTLMRRLRALRIPPAPSQRRTIAAVEGKLRAAKDPGKVATIWEGLSDSLRTEPGIIAATSTAFVTTGAPRRAVGLLMSFLHNHRPSSLDQTAQALLLTSLTKSIAACARVDPILALRACDAIRAQREPLFNKSLPLTGAYFTVLQHSRLPLSETLERIAEAKERHIQLDERAFSMALGAILRCDARLMERLAEGRAWLEVMKDAQIPLTVHTYNLLAGQMRYCNDPEMVTSLLRDMTATGVKPTAVTYGLVFSACVIPGDYTSPARRTALPVSLWEEVLEAMEGHMSATEVRHTPNSRLSLARAYAHLGRTSRALREFDAYIKYMKVVDGSTDEVESAYEQMVFNFAHCRECSTDGPHAALDIFQGRPSDSVLDALLVACVRTGQAGRAVELAGTSNDAALGETGLRHLLKAHAELRDSECWESTRSLITRHRLLLETESLGQVVQELVIAFARAQRRDICDDIMKLAGIEVSDLEYVLKGREFLRMRRTRQVKSEEGRSASPVKETKILENAPEQRNGSWETRSRSFHDNGVLPLI